MNRSSAHPWVLYGSMLFALLAGTFAFWGAPVLGPDVPRVQAWLADGGEPVGVAAYAARATGARSRWGANPFFTGYEVATVGDVFAYVGYWTPERPQSQQELPRLEALIKVDGGRQIAILGGKAAAEGGRYGDVRLERIGDEHVVVTIDGGERHVLELVERENAGGAR